MCKVSINKRHGINSTSLLVVGFVATREVVYSVPMLPVMTRSMVLSPSLRSEAGMLIGNLSEEKLKNILATITTNSLMHFS